jgi:C-terminal processing protease CtpA/Prc
LIDTIKNAHGIILDLRKTARNSDEYGDYYESEFMKRFIPYITDHGFGYPSYRSRIHYGHESETFSMSSFYYQGWFLQNSTVINKNPKAIHEPVCLLVNRFDSDISDAIAALQEEQIVKVVADDSLRNFEPASTYPMKLADSVTVNIRMTEVIYNSGNKTFSPDIIISRNNFKTGDTLIQTAIRLLKPGKEFKKIPGRQLQNVFVSNKIAGYDSLVYPPASLRLLGLMRYWSAINYFCPNKDRITKNWDSVLYEYVPKFLQAKDSMDYALTVARLIKEINDTHGFFSSPVFNPTISEVPEIQLKYVEGKTIVYRVFSDSLKKILSVGDEIITVDNTPLKKSRDSIAQYIGASNDVSLQRDVTMRVLAGRENSSVKIDFLHKGKLTHITLPRTANLYKIGYMPQDGPVFKKLGDKIGYVDMGRLEVSQIDSMFSAFMNTDAIIIDDRSYPRGTVWSLVSYLSKTEVTSAKGSTIIAGSPDPLSRTVQEDLWQLPVTPKPQYKGKIIMLVNEITLSQAEYSCMVLQAADKKVTIIGSQTSGADGDVTGIKIPGGIQTAFSGHGVHYPDGRPTQGIGIIPDIKVTPTINGIKAGKDEVLERAILFVKTGK